MKYTDEMHVAYENLRLGRVRKSSKLRPICSAYGAKNFLPLGMGSVKT